MFEVKVSGAWTVPLVIIYSMVVITMLVFHVSSIERKLPDPSCAFYVNTVEHFQQRTSTLATGTVEGEAAAYADYLQEIARVEESQTSYNCSGEVCLDSIEVILYKLCDTSGDYNSAVIERTVFK